MQVMRTLPIRLQQGTVTVEVGTPDAEAELEQMFMLRFRIYKEHDYIETLNLTSECEIDRFDIENKCVYFIAKVREHMIGSVRLIRASPLPTEIYFQFDPPQQMEAVPDDAKAEISRLVVSPKVGDMVWLPRHVIMLSLFQTIVDYCKTNHYRAGYAFIKRRLFYVLRRLRFPFYAIDTYTQRYPEDGVLYRYFHDASDPVIPIYYFLEDIERYFSEVARLDSCV